MSGELLGADPEQLRAFAKEVDESATKLKSTSASLSAIVARTSWTGPDASRFKSSWGSHRATLIKVSAGLSNIAKLLTNNAAEQDKASSSASYSGASPTQKVPQNPASDNSLIDKLNGMTAAERAAYLKSAEFKEWAAKNPEQAKVQMDLAVQNGLIPTKSPEYANFLSDYWNAKAMERQGIDPSKWDTSKGTSYNWDIIKKVYEFYGKQYLANGDLQWAGMANMIGPSFAGGFKDLDMMRSFAQQILNGPLEHIPDDKIQKLRLVAAMTDGELKYYETKMLDMNKEIFLDQARQHMAYEQGGLTEINKLAASGAITQETARAWALIDSGDAEKIKLGNTILLDREQNTIIKDDYDTMRAHPITGEAVTYLITLAGEPSIPGAKSFPEVFPLKINIETPGPDKVPFVGWDNPLQGTVEVTTPLPDGNIANAEQRWALIKEDTLPAYQKLLAENPELAAQIIGSNFDDRVEEARPTNNIPEILERMANGFDVDVKQ